jgi:hypothetical protein
MSSEESTPSHRDEECSSEGSLKLLLSNVHRTSTERAPARKGTNAKMLERVSTELLHHALDGNLTHPDLERFLVDDFTAHLDHYSSHPISQGREEFLNNYKAFAEANPGYATTIEHVYADVNDKNGTASVWMLLSVTGQPEGVRMESVTVISWKRSEGKWRAYRQKVIRGLSAIE